jgi:iron complex transport system substrate-binding protein
MISTLERSTLPNSPAAFDAEFYRIVDTLTRRTLIGGGLGAATLGLTACGSNGSSSPSPSASITTRKVRGAYGDVDLPAHPQRVVALSKAAVTTVLDLGITPVGVDEGEAAVALPQYRTRIKPLPTVGTYGQFDIEKIAALKPDLLISYDTYIDHKLYAQVKDLVPTFALKTDEGNIAWQAATTGFANAVNRNSQLAAWKKKYTDQLARTQATYRTQLASNRWEVIQKADAGNFYRYLPSADALTVLTQLGATLGNATAKGPNYYGNPISNEDMVSQLGKATVILGVELGNDSVTSSPLRKKLPATTAGHTYFSNELFISGYSGAIALLDFITDLCAKLKETK